MGEHVLCKHEVVGSIPIASTTLRSYELRVAGHPETVRSRSVLRSFSVGGRAARHRDWLFITGISEIRMLWPWGLCDPLLFDRVDRNLVVRGFRACRRLAFSWAIACGR